MITIEEISQYVARLLVINEQLRQENDRLKEENTRLKNPTAPK